ncbi:hypothetical protein CDEST_08682 [Colletotrichum destructivum]|uniref:Uncharacterized protein n=1 Tax=Colletotrichum destructivum TaxID=34406 RepID=A0AAX4IKX9_9PEZI|nr:hypothetical protein CDEST_08682 [Colletotrichum destructivum]
MLVCLSGEVDSGCLASKACPEEAWFSQPNTRIKSAHAYLHGERTHARKLTLFFAGPAAGAHGSVAPFDNVTLGAGVRVVTPVQTGTEVHTESAAIGANGQDAGGEKKGNGGDSHGDERGALDLGVWDRSWRA